MPALELDLVSLLREVAAHGGSDLHLIHGIPPIARISGNLGTLPFPPLESESIMRLLEPYLSETIKHCYQTEYRVNFSVTIPALGRFRFNMAQAQGTPGATIRIIPSKTFPLSSLGLPPVVGSLARSPSGIVFITGATGSGKSTTMAAMIEHVNQTGDPGKVITIEDPIETLFKPAKSIFVQREVGVDTPSFLAGIEDALRQDPDVLCIGELRDLASIQAGLTAAETGHLVLTTLHTRDASKTAHRIVSAFPAGSQEGVREQLAMTLEGVISQELLPRADGKGLVVAVEVLIPTPAVRQMIRENKLEAINDAMLAGSGHGMISKDTFVKELYQKRTITREVALEHMRNPQLLGK